MKLIIQNLMIVSVSFLAACGGGSSGGDDGFVGTWLLNLQRVDTTGAGGEDCPSSPAIASSVVINQGGTAVGSEIVVNLDTGETLVGDVRSSQSFVTGRVIQEIDCGDGRTGDQVFSFGFDALDGDLAEGWQNYLIPCGPNACRTLYKGNATRQN